VIEINQIINDVLQLGFCQENMDLEKKKFYLKIFTSIDEDVNGYLSDRELKKFLISCDIPVNCKSYY